MAKPISPPSASDELKASKYARAQEVLDIFVRDLKWNLGQRVSEAEYRAICSYVDSLPPQILQLFEGV